MKKTNVDATDNNNEVKVENVVKVDESVGEVKSVNYGSKFRDNPWILVSVVLGIILLGFIIFNFGGNGLTGDVISEDVAAQNLLSFIQKSGNAPGPVNIISSEKEGQLYKINLNYNGQSFPVYMSLDGKYLISDVIPLAGGLPNSGTANPSQGAVDVEIGDSPVKGDENAPVTIIEFSDFQCPFCKKFVDETLPSIQKDYIKTGKVKLVFKDFPLVNIHDNAQEAAEAARCVREQKGDTGFWRMHDLIFKNQDKLSPESIRKWALEVGASGAKFDSCLSEGKYTEAVNDEAAYGQQLGVTGTPAFFINGKLVSGAQPYSAFKQAIEAELASA